MISSQNRQLAAAYHQLGYPAARADAGAFPAPIVKPV
jgi:hypothetical protein